MTLNVYYLDDEVELGDLFKEIFETPRIVISTFTEPALFIAAVNAAVPDLAFVDYRLPGTTGELVVASIRHTFPKILVTGEVQINASQMFSKVLSKPISIHEVTELLEQYARLKGV